MRRFARNSLFSAIVAVTVMSAIPVSSAGQNPPTKPTVHPNKTDQTVITEKNKWNGEFTFSGGTNFEHQNDDASGGSPYFTNINAGGSVKIGYTSEKFYINGLVNCHSGTKNTERTGYTGKINVGSQSDSLLTSNVEFSDIFTKNLNLNGTLNAGWRLDMRNKFDFRYAFAFTVDSPYKNVMSTDFESGVKEIDTSSIRNIGLRFSNESTLNRQTDHRFSLKYLHDFEKPGRKLEAVMDADIGISDKSTEYSLLTMATMSDTASFDARAYRLTPVYHDDAASLLVKYTDKNFVDVSGLDVDFFFKMDFKADIDEFSAANYVNQVWKDSTECAEKFRNHEYKPAPGFHLFWSKSKLSADVAYSPQFFFYNIFDSEHTGRLYMGTTSHLIDVKGSYKPWAGHSFDVIYKRDVTRPEYLQLCPFERGGSSSSETVQGNPDLMPAARNRISLSYNYATGRFSTLLETGAMHEKRKIVNQIIIDKDEQGLEHRIKTWKNAEDGYTANARLSLFWKGAVLKADLSANLNYFYGIKEKEDTRTSDWSLNGHLSYQLKTWHFNTGLNYRSKIIRQYISMTEIIGLDLKVEKKFARFSLAVEGRNLLDKNVIVVTESDDGLYGRYEDTDNNNRLFLLGLKYSF